jgi:UDP-N-acetyl-D-glucosamine dehydrogenase
VKICVVGLGKIGLPLAVQYATKGHTVVGLDVAHAVVDAVNRGCETFPGEADLAERLAAVALTGNLRATTDPADALLGCDVVVVVVPLVVDQDSWEPDFSLLDSATRSFGPHLEPGALVCYETTLPVGTTRTRWLPLIEELSGLHEGDDLHVVFSPERVFTGRIFADLRRYPKLIGAVTPSGAITARTFYESVLDFDEREDLPQANGVWDLGTPEAAEFAKLAETTYRDVNIGLANQFAKFAETARIDVHMVIEASNSQPFSHIHKPGIAVGGHCIPVYPRLYLWNDPQATIVQAAREANLSMPGHVVSRLAAAAGDIRGRDVAVLGAAYRGGVKETAFSGVFSIVAALEAAGARALVHDPLFTDDELSGMGFTAYHRGDPADCIVVHTDHAEYTEWTASDVPGIQALADGRNLMDAENWSGVRFVSLGRTTATPS